MACLSLRRFVGRGIKIFNSCGRHILKPPTEGSVRGAGATTMTMVTITMAARTFGSMERLSGKSLKQQSRISALPRSLVYFYPGSMANPAGVPVKFEARYLFG